MRTAEQRAVLAAADAIKRAERKAKKAQRPKSEKATRGRVVDTGYLQWLRRQPCRVAGMTCSGAIEAAHVRYSDASRGKVNPGLQCKPSDRFAVSLCAGHHRGPGGQHAAGNERAWWSSYGKDGLAEADAQFAEYQEQNL
jgi:hypothetical protein